MRTCRTKKMQGNNEKESRLETMEKYYLVALPEDRILKRALQLQKEFSRRYRVYQEPFPPLHVTLGILYIPRGRELAAASRLLTPLLQRHLPFRLKVKGSSCFPPPYKSVNLKVVSPRKLRHISRQVSKALQPAGIKCHPMEDWDYHISLVNTVFAVREWTEEEYLEACELLGQEKLHLSCRIRHVQLWYPEFPPLKVMGNFTCKDRGHSAEG